MVRFRSVGCRTLGCLEDPTDGEGWDGYCGHCADELEEKMGYTHYWTQTRDFTAEEMLLIGDAIAKIIRTASGRAYPNNYSDEHGQPISLKICGGDGEGKPALTEEAINFNGQGPDLDHETFYFKAKREVPYEGAFADQLGSGFCKTARKPYDVVVTAALTYLQSDWGFEVSSDGGVEEWEPGVALAEEALGRAFANPIIIEELMG